MNPEESQKIRPGTKKGLLWGVIVCAAGAFLLVLGCLRQPSDRAGDAPARGTTPTDRPIFYLGGDRSVAIFPDGRPAKPKFEEGQWLAVWSPSGSQFAYWETDRTTRLARIRVASPRGEAKTVFEATRPANRYWDHMVAPAWSPDGKHLAVIWGDLVVVDVDRGEVEARVKLPLNVWGNGLQPQRFQWSPDGGKVLLSWNRALVIDRQSLAIKTFSQRPIYAEWGPQGEGLYYFELDLSPAKTPGVFHFRPLGASTPGVYDEPGLIGPPGLPVGPNAVLLRLSPSGSKLVVAALDRLQGKSILAIYQVDPQQPFPLPAPTTTIEKNANVVEVDWSPDEMSLAAVTIRYGIVIERVDLSTGRWTELATVSADRGGAGLVEGYALAGMNDTMSWAR